MEFLLIVCLLSYILMRAIFAIFRIGEPKNLPPGPMRLPVIGNLHLLGDQPHQSLAKLAEIHGPIMSLKLGHITTLVISSASVTKEVLLKQDPAFSSRHIPDAVHVHNHARYSVTWLDVCTEWRALRRILNSNIFSHNSLEANQHLRSQKVEELIAYCRKASLSNDHVDIGRAAFRTSLNLLSNTIFSKDLTDPYNEDSGKEFKEVVRNIMIEIGKPNLADYFPILKKIDPQRIRRRLTHHFGKVFEIFDDLIQERLRIEKSNHDDVLDMCLKIIQDNPNEINQTHIKSLFMDLFTAGTDTTSSTVEWAMTELLRNPRIMTKAKEELEHVIGKGKIIKEDDISRLPNLSRIVKETLRMHSPVPFDVRKVIKQVELNGYTIPKGTQVLVNAWAIGRDPAVWDDSLEFKPERFLETGLDFQGRDFNLFPFGAGRRICPGLPLAMRMIPIMLGSLLNSFDWNIDTKAQHEAFDMTEKFGLTLVKAIPLCVVPIPLN